MKIPDELTCKEIVELVTDYLEQTLVSEMRARFEQRWILALALVLIVSIALFTVTTILPGRQPATTISHISCNTQPSSTNKSSAPSANVCHRKLLVFSKTGAFRHASIPAAVAAL